MCAKIVEWVSKNPGRTSKDICATLGFKRDTGLLSYMRKTGAIYVAGPMHWTRYYATAAEADANHERIMLEAVETRTRNERRANRDFEEKRKVRRQQAAEIRRVLRSLPPGVEVSPTVKITIAKTPPPRFAPSPGWAGGVFKSAFVTRLEIG